ncbi:MAG TPA: UDP-N-acetylglucosamine 2-epimerase (non-hydrolyzing) [Candidatus Angelobacter sp.]|nr:UDP-N-acetylglucosamine 2-epimerase (non-hydrolyzing) [Candidatus Angelobacter sp.]
MTSRRFKIFNVVGTRPNMMKMAPIVAEMRRLSEAHPVLVHTGQHYDFRMSQVFLEQLNLGEPDHNLNVGSGSHHGQTAQILEKFGELVMAERPDMIVVAGDVNSTMACALVGAKELIPVAHVEAGLRSFDRSMPEEINRIVADSISDLLFTTEQSGTDNLIQEGIPQEKIVFTGNAMIDSLVAALKRARTSSIGQQLGLQPGKYILVTLHRPSNVDQAQNLEPALRAIVEIAQHYGMPAIFPVHPRTQARVALLQIAGIENWDSQSAVKSGNVWLMPPASYLDFLSLMDRAAIVITDSGGIQEETTYLGIPCLTYRDNTERPVTVQHGTNHLVGADPAALIATAKQVLSRPKAPHRVPPLWDGRAAERIVASILSYLRQRSELAAQKAAAVTNVRTQ